jgi:hypothetical protein
VTIGSRITKIERALRLASDAPPSDDEVRWAYKVNDRWAALLVRQIMAEDDETLALTDEQIAFMNSAEVVRAHAICGRYLRARGVGPIDFDANRRLPKHDLADIEAKQLAAEAAEASEEQRASV